MLSAQAKNHATWLPPDEKVGVAQLAFSMFVKMMMMMMMMMIPKRIDGSRTECPTTWPLQARRSSASLYILGWIGQLTSAA